MSASSFGLKVGTDCEETVGSAVDGVKDFVDRLEDVVDRVEDVKEREGVDIVDLWF